jgi:small subunit ribosomal protein S4
MQLREKQKVKRIYGVLEKPFRAYFARAERKKGIAGENLLQTLELRMDNIVYRMGLAPSRNAARQLVKHNHFTVNGKKVNIPSYILSKGDEVAPAQKKIGKFPIKTALESMKDKSQPHWLAFDIESKKGIIQDLPSREDITIPIEEQLIVELYSR